MRDVGDAIKIFKIIVIIWAVVLLAIKVPDWITRARINREMKEYREMYQKRGPSNIVRGGYAHKADTAKVDSIK